MKFRQRLLPFSLDTCLPVSSLKTEILKETEIYRNIILPVVLYGCETWSLTLMEDHRLRVFDNRVLMRIFGPKREEVAGA
jgi:hypothetical protein